MQSVQFELYPFSGSSSIAISFTLLIQNYPAVRERYFSEYYDGLYCRHRCTFKSITFVAAAVRNDLWELRCKCSFIPLLYCVCVMLVAPGSHCRLAHEIFILVVRRQRI